MGEYLMDGLLMEKGLKIYPFSGHGSHAHVCRRSMHVETTKGLQSSLSNSNYLILKLYSSSHLYPDSLQLSSSDSPLSGRKMSDLLCHLLVCLPLQPCPCCILTSRRLALLHVGQLKLSLLHIGGRPQMQR